MTNDNVDMVNKCQKIPVQEVQTPKEGYVVKLNRWWTLTPDECVLFDRRCSPQCHSNEQIAKGLTQQLYPKCTTVFIPVAYFPPFRL